MLLLFGVALIGAFYAAFPALLRVLPSRRELRLAAPMIPSGMKYMKTIRSTPNNAGDRTSLPLKKLGRMGGLATKSDVAL